MPYQRMTPVYTPYSGAGSLMTNQSRVTLPPTWQTSRGFAFNVAAPASCSDESTKVSNLRALLRSSESDLQELENYQRKSDFLNTGLLVSGLVMDTSIGFLDLAASMFSVISPAASKAAKAGILAIESTEQIGEAVTGQTSAWSAFWNIFDNSVDTATSIAEPKTIAGKIMLSNAKLHYDAAVITIKSTINVSDQDIKNDAFTLIKDRSKDLGGIVADGLKEGNMKAAGKTLEGLIVVGEVFESAEKYHKNLENRFDTYLQNKENDAVWIANSKSNLRTLMSNIRGQLDRAISELEACQLKA